MDYVDSKINLTTNYITKVAGLVSKFGVMESSSEPTPETKLVVVEPVTAASVTFDFSSYIVKVIIGIYLVNQLVPPGERNLRIIMYILVVLGGGYPLIFLILLWLFKMQITKK